MSIEAMTWVFKHSEAKGNDRLVLLAIADEAADDGTSAFPGMDRIAMKARVPKRTVMRAIERLEADGALEVERPEKRGRGHHNTYRVVMEKGDTLTPDGQAGTARNGAQRRAAVANSFQTPIPIDPNQGQDLAPTGAVEKPTSDPVKKAAHALTVLAFEQPVKPELRDGGKGAFPAAMALIERLLRSGRSVQRIEAAIMAGVEVWTLAGLQTSVAKVGDLSPRMSRSQTNIDAAMAALRQEDERAAIGSGDGGADDGRDLAAGDNG